MNDTTIVHYLQPENTSPFDAIRQMTKAGREFWSARDLQKLLGYKEWRKFEDAIERARVACKIAGHNPDEQIAPVANLSKRGKYATQEQADYHLTRYACYLIAMNGDPRKEEIAQAQTYFAVQTRKAETAQEPQQIAQEPQPAPLQGNVHKAINDDRRRKRLIAALNKIEEGHQEVDALLFPKKTAQQTSSVKQLKAPATPEHIEDQIVKHLRKHGPLTLNMLRTSYLKRYDEVTLSRVLTALVRADMLTSTDTAYGTKKYALVESIQPMSIS